MKNVLFFLCFTTYLIFCVSCSKDIVSVKQDYEIKFTVLPVTESRYRYPIDTVVNLSKDIYLVKTIKDNMATLLRDLDVRGYKPVSINYTINAMDLHRNEIVKITEQVMNVSSKQFFLFGTDKVTVEFFYYDASGSSLDDRFVGTDTVAMRGGYTFVERK